MKKLSENFGDKNYSFCLLYFNNLETSDQTDENSKDMLNENLSLRNQVVSCRQTEGRTDTHDEANSPLFATLRNRFKVILIHRKCILSINLVYDEDALNCTRFIHIYLLPIHSAISEMLVLYPDSENRCVLVVIKVQDQTLRLATKRRDFLLEFVFFLWKFICMLLFNCQHVIIISKDSYVGMV